MPAALATSITVRIVPSVPALRWARALLAPRPLGGDPCQVRSTARIDNKCDRPSQILYTTKAAQTPIEWSGTRGPTRGSTRGSWRRIACGCGKERGGLGGIPYGQGRCRAVAGVVSLPENPRVGGSIPSLATNTDNDLASRGFVRISLIVPLTSPCARLEHHHWAPRIVQRGQDGTFSKVSARDYTAFQHGEAPLPRSTGSEAHLAELVVELENRRAVKLRQHWYRRFHLKQNGFLDAEARHEENDLGGNFGERARAAGTLIGEVRSARGQLLQRRLQSRIRWEPSARDLEALSALVNRRAGRHLMGPPRPRLVR